MPSPVSLTLVVPGLLWPAQALADLSQGLALPALCRLLGSGRRMATPAASSQELIARRLGFATPLPAAALRHGALGLATPEGHCICLDPIHLGFVERKMMIGDPQALALDMTEAKALAVSLAPTFAAFGELQVAAPNAWHLRLASGQAEPATTPLPDLIGRRADLGLAMLDKPWRQALNDAQILLHAHPVNQAREAAGKPVVNSLWPWGGGSISTAAATTPQTTTLWTEALELQGLARHLGLASAPLPTAWPGSATGNIIALLDNLAGPARRADGQAWREELVRLERDWFASLSANPPACLRIEFSSNSDGSDGSHGMSFESTRGTRLADRFAFWRKPATLSRLSQP